MTHHPHVHMIVPGGGIAPDGQRWITSRPAFLLPVRVLGMLFRRLFLDPADGLQHRGKLSLLRSWRTSMTARVPASPRARSEEALGRLCQAAVRRPEAVLAYLSRYTHRVAISNRRLIAR
jgi:hypothetical protein